MIIKERNKSRDNKSLFQLFCVLLLYSFTLIKDQPLGYKRKIDS